METTFKDHSTTEIEAAIGKALGELFGSPVSVNIRKTTHQRPADAAVFLSNSRWSVDLEMSVVDAPPELGDDDPF